MMVVNVVTAICLASLIIEVITMAVAYAIKNSAEKVEFLRSFKKGKCVIIYLIAVPLFCVGIYHGGGTFIDAFFGSIAEIVNLVVLKYSTSKISALMSVNAFYSFTVYAVFFMVALNAILFSLSLFGQRLWVFFRTIAFTVTRKEKLFVFGYNANNLSIYKSDKKRAKVIAGKVTDADSVKLYANRVLYFRERYKHLVDTIFRNVARGVKVTAVINTENDETNLIIGNAFLDKVNTLSAEEKRKLFLRLKIFIFGDQRFASIYEDLSSAVYGCMSVVDRYQKSAIDLIDRYPFTQFLSSEQVDYSTSMIREGVDINAIMIGFGKMNRQIFLTSVANNQFITSVNGKVTAKNVNYVIFDKQDGQSNKNLNFDYYRYKNEVKDAKEYLPLPEMPANEDFRSTDINAPSFYNEIREITTKNKSDYNFIFVAFASDLENIDMAQKLLQKQAEWSVKNLVVFVKSRSIKKSETSIEQENCYFIGNDKQVVFNIDKLLGDRMQSMAKKRNEYYFIEKAKGESGNELDEKTLEDICVKANEKQYTEKTRIERESGLYSCLSLRSKLQLMGLDYSFGDKGISKEEYMSVYKKAERPFYMAVHEHYRWNAFMISKGMIPATIDQIKNEEVELADGTKKFTNGKNYAFRRHGNITTLEGLDCFKKMIAKRDGISEESADVFKYDYQLLDLAYEVLKESGGVIVKTKND